MTEATPDFATLADNAIETDPIVPDNVNLGEEMPADPADKRSYLRRVLIGDEGEPKPKRTKTKKPPPPKPRPGTLVKPLTDFYTSIGMLMVPFDPFCGGAVVKSAPKCAEAMENLARENPAVRRAILSVIETSVWGQVIVAHSPIIMAVAAHHVPKVRNGMEKIAEKATAESAERFLREQNQAE